ncbi:MAG: sensor histidine kinase, partial [Actinomycetes bacterium]
ARLAAVSPEETARRAVIAERRRLLVDVEACVRECLETVATLAADLPGAHDPTPLLRRIQAEAQRATTELRRQLGLLRAEESEPPPPVASAGDPQPRLRTADFLLAAAVVAVAGVDIAAGIRFEGVRPGWAGVGLTLAGAATVLLRRVAPARGALLCAALLAFGTALGRPLLDGFWLPLAVGLPAWVLAAQGGLQAWLTIAGLGAALVVSRLAYVPDNAPINAALLALVIAGGVTLGRSRRAQTAAQQAASAREQVLRAAAEEAVAAERRALARELHDVVSHAVSVIAVQAGAAEVSWPSDRVGARRAMAVVAATAQQTVTELDRLLPGASPRHDLHDLDALLDRMRAAGLTVSLDRRGEPAPELSATIYRVVQECLTNALRHAPRSRVEVRIISDRLGTRVEVWDDGPGPAAGGRRGYGLTGLAERVAQSGGTVRSGAASAAGGFVLTAELPARMPVP